MAYKQIITLPALQEQLRKVGDHLMRGNHLQGVEALLSVFDILNEYAKQEYLMACSDTTHEMNLQAMKQWDDACSAALGLAAPYLTHTQFQTGLINLLADEREFGRSASLEIVASGGEYGYRTLFVTLAVGVLCSLFYPTVVHGNRAVTGCGCGKYAEADILESLTPSNIFPFPPRPIIEYADGYVASQIQKHNFSFAYTQSAFPLFWRFAAVRGHCGLRDVLKLAGTLCPPVGSKYAYIGLWSNDIVDSAHSILTNTKAYENFILVSGNNDQYDELGPDGGVVRRRCDDFLSSIVATGGDIEWAETKDDVSAKQEMQRLADIMAPPVSKDSDLTAVRRSMAILNAAYALSILPKHSAEDIGSLQKMITISISSGEALSKFENLKHSDYRKY